MMMMMMMMMIMMMVSDMRADLISISFLLNTVRKRLLLWLGKPGQFKVATDQRVPGTKLLVILQYVVW